MIELVSMHIPKTAGRSFLAILNSVYDSDSIAHFDHNNYPDKSIPEVQQFKSELNDRIKIIHGHFHFKEINDLKNIQTAKFITWLRNPVERVISNYSFFKKRISLSLDDDKLQRRKNESLMDYASLENSRNRMSKFMEGLEINDFYFIGIMEYFNSDIVRLSEMLNWKPFQIPRVNDNSEYKSQLPLVTNEEKKIIEELNGNDIDLYMKVLEIQNKKTT